MTRPRTLSAAQVLDEALAALEQLVTETLEEVRDGREALHARAHGRHRVEVTVLGEPEPRFIDTNP